MKYNLFLSGILLLFVIAFSSCMKLDLSPTDKFVDKNYWTSKEKAQMFLNKGYSQMAGATQIFDNEFLSDNCYQSKGSSSEMTIVMGNADSNNERFASEWASCYEGIKTCHIFLENVNRVPNLSELDLLRFKAEARFLRAFFYLRLTTWFGDVPLFDRDITLEESKTISRTKHADVVAFIHSELEDIVDDLPTVDQLVSSELGRITKGAAVALNARAYLYDNDFQNVATWCEKLMNDKTFGTYSLFSSYPKLFTMQNQYSNSEYILEIGYAYPRNWNNLFDLAPISCKARSIMGSPTQELVDNYIMLNGKAITEAGSGYDASDPYEGRDPRMDATIVRHLSPMTPLGATTSKIIYIKPGSTNNTTDMVDMVGHTANSTHTGYYYRKFYESTMLPEYISNLNLPLIRYADVLLMYAEAMNETGGMSVDVWDKTIGALRKRAGFKNQSAIDFPSGSTEDLTAIIRAERRSELALEGTRVFDIRRWKIAEDVLNGYPHGAKWGDTSIDNGYIRLQARKFNPLRDYLWAVPLTQRDINKNLTQNPKYQ